MDSNTQAQVKASRDVGLSLDNAGNHKKLSITHARLRWRNAEGAGLRGGVSYAVVELTPNRQLLQGRSINVDYEDGTVLGLVRLSPEPLEDAAE